MYIRFVFIFSVVLCLCGSCSKLVEIDPPRNTITTGQVFSTDAQATAAMAGVYINMLNYGALGSGRITMFAGLSADELLAYGGVNASYYPFNANRLLLQHAPSDQWTSAYQSVYDANAIMEGIAGSTSGKLHDDVKKGLTGEAKFVRAFSYFYLTNLFGDVPLVLTVDFNKTKNLPNAPQEQVYKQIIQDLQEAVALLPEDYSASNGGVRVRPNKWAATLLLARALLYTGNYKNAAAQATTVINQTSLYNLESNLNNVFSTSSREAIWQLQQDVTNNITYNATFEGCIFQPVPVHTGQPYHYLSPELLSAFESGDHRRKDWVDSTDNSIVPGGAGNYHYPSKYKIGNANADRSGMGVATEYYTMLRLAEAYLIRAEASAHDAGISAAITDLNIIRKRAGLTDLPTNLNQSQVLAAVAKERQTEFFCEWGHRWLDLKRTGKATQVLSAIPLKRPWQGDFQLLYPIPQSEIQKDPYLKQNQGY
ncbi:MAG: RagB/SusD family nutrient uptake outer membrane protein [Chitinophaga sp.]|uniref:RagB/SusD family nutrient uptake outer membrane protein n=1 Tax=Chitinophaga sp. TaxID=1869181 RepID=UPI001B19D8A0|nr:RagB/SusD family nutrient uptake outer membrane protein [Chitinophaga sp.]MBO9728519.1 RagB/SusD family nutrient uptake outer membrane protein [Chitinophaga sp.]